jgi:lambda repressor-like predicted transcriptional regulator
MKWIDQYSGSQYRITTTGHHGDRHTARVKTYGDVLHDYEIHPEAKYADASGKPCGKETIGLLQRRHVRIDLIRYIGKESNSLESVEAGLIHSEQSAYTIYADPRRDEWQTKILPALRKIPVPILVRQTGLSSTTIKDALAGRTRPYRRNQKILAAIVRGQISMH